MENTEANNLMEKYNNAISNKDEFSATIIATRLKNLGYELEFEEEINYDKYIDDDDIPFF